MNNPIEHPLVRAHLDAVARYTATLPAERRRELLADLREHIEVSLAEGPAGNDTVRTVLEQLGAPRQIADAALAEEGRTLPAPETAGWTTLTLAFAVLALPLALVPVVGSALGLASAVIATVRVAKSRQWTRREKQLATVLLLSPVLLVPLFAAAITATAGRLTPGALLTAIALGFCPSPLAAFRLSRSAARLRTAAVAA